MSGDVEIAHMDFCWSHCIKNHDAGFRYEDCDCPCHADRAQLAQAWREGHAAGRDYQGDGWNSDLHDPEKDNPYKSGGGR